MYQYSPSLLGLRSGILVTRWSDFERPAAPGGGQNDAITTRHRLRQPPSPPHHPPWTPRPPTAFYSYAEQRRKGTDYRHAVAASPTWRGTPNAVTTPSPTWRRTSAAVIAPSPTWRRTNAAVVAAFPNRRRPPLGGGPRRRHPRLPQPEEDHRRPPLGGGPLTPSSTPSPT